MLGKEERRVRREPETLVGQGRIPWGLWGQERNLEFTLCVMRKHGVVLEQRVVCCDLTLSLCTAKSLLRVLGGEGYWIWPGALVQPFCSPLCRELGLWSGWVQTWARDGSPASLLPLCLLCTLCTASRGALLNSKARSFLAAPITLWRESSHFSLTPWPLTSVRLFPLSGMLSPTGLSSDFLIAHRGPSSQKPALSSPCLARSLFLLGHFIGQIQRNTQWKGAEAVRN